MGLDNIILRIAIYIGLSVLLLEKFWVEISLKKKSFLANKTVSGHFKSGHSDLKKKVQQYCCKLQQKCCKILSKYSKKQKNYLKNKILRFDGLMFLWKTLEIHNYSNSSIHVTLIVTWPWPGHDMVRVTRTE